MCFNVSYYVLLSRKERGERGGGKEGRKEGSKSEEAEDLRVGERVCERRREGWSGSVNRGTDSIALTRR